MTGTARASIPQVRSRFGVPPQVARPAARTLSRWRHGFKSRWDYLLDSTRSTEAQSKTRRLRLVPGAGQPWFADDGPRAPLRLVDGTVTSTVAILATYERAAS
jgi:hypothetical protein